MRPSEKFREKGILESFVAMPLEYGETDSSVYGT
jgi:hypothetical protein